MQSALIVALAECRRRRDAVPGTASAVLARFALDKCEETFLRRDWLGFATWLRAYKAAQPGRAALRRPR